MTIVLMLGLSHSMLTKIKAIIIIIIIYDNSVQKLPIRRAEKMKKILHLQTLEKKKKEKKANKIRIEGLLSVHYADCIADLCQITSLRPSFNVPLQKCDQMSPCATFKTFGNLF